MKLLVDILLKHGVISPSQAEDAKSEAKKTGLAFDKALVRLGFTTEETITKAVADEMGVLYMDLKSYVIDQDVIKLIPESTAKKFKVVPVFKIGDSLTVAMANPQDITVIDNIRRASGVIKVEPVLSTEEDIQKAIEQYYGATGSMDDLIKNITKPRGLSDEMGADKLAEIAEEAPLVKLVNMLMLQAIKEKASDIHVEPGEDLLRVRYRVDGILHEVTELPKHLESAFISRIKILSKIDISERRKPQDGRIMMKMQDKEIDFRVSTFPTVYGENVVMRILDRSSAILRLIDLGFSPGDLKNYNELIKRAYGIILVTGPTGSGKTTTLYSSLSAINSMEKNIITIEDPVEYEIPLIRQTQVNVKAGLTFATGLRSILRQDPDIIMVGEIRDKETAEIAIQAALTGHLVFSTLHTNDAPGSLTRLIDMGIEPFLISSTVIGVLAQRLVRVICGKCKEAYQPAENVLNEFGIKEKINFYRGKGCDKCRGTGYSGRIGIYELLVIDDELKKMVVNKDPGSEIKKRAIKSGLTTLREDGIQKVKNGITTIEEVMRVTEEV